MNRLSQACCWIVVISTAVQSVVAQENAPADLFSTKTNLSAAQPEKSPVDFFRKLLAMTPDEQENYLANRPPQIRERILAKIQEYEALDPDERELRLRATELHWYLVPLLHESPTNYPARLAQIPADMRDLVRNRLEQWEILPPSFQQEFLDDERAVDYFAEISSSPLDPRNPLNSLSQDDRKKIIERVNHFFDLTTDEKQETLSTLSDAERQQMERTLRTFDSLPVNQREECIQAFAKFASMNAVEKQEFLKNAARWAQMSPADRQAWRDLVKNVPEWPPLPQGAFPPPPMPSAIATNHN